MSNNVKFSRGKTEVEALRSEDGNVIYFTKDSHSIVMGGKLYGSSIESEKKEYLDKLYSDYIESLFTISSSVSSSTVNPGTEVTITVTVKNSGINCSSDSPLVCTGFLNGSTFTEVSPGLYRLSVRIESVGIYTSTITAEYSGIKKSCSVTISCYGNIIYGWSSSSSISSISDIVDASSYGPASSSVGEFKFSNSGIGYYYFLIPTGTKIASSLERSEPQGVEGPIPVYFTRQSDIPGYVVFRISDAQSPSEHNIKFS